ncbi:aspartate/glutamate racemase family protein [Marinobacterium sp. YM272]|uniref:aspartate/glutamate racemase family protein n=1 Tax=Marinobacterium sp. YM272 TaxID=3421654 RepID=UPI003D7FDF45
MKLLIINPNISTSVSDLIRTEAERCLMPGTSIEVMTAPFGVAYIETRAEALIGGYAAMQLAAEHYADYDAVIIAAFGDPGLEAIREMLPCPVIGMTEAALASAALYGGRCSIIAISNRIKSWYRETAEQQGFGSRLSSIRSLSESLANIGTVQQDQGTRLIALAHEAIEQDGADCLIMAGAPLAGLARSVSEQIPVPVLDGVSCAVRQAQVQVLAGSQVRSAGSYAPPPEKGHQGLPLALAALIGRASDS